MNKMKKHFITISALLVFSIFEYLLVGNHGIVVVFAKYVCTYAIILLVAHAISSKVTAVRYTAAFFVISAFVIVVYFTVNLTFNFVI